jgi:hypothetical protein
MENTPSPARKPDQPETIDRREFLERVGKTALYSVPVVAYIASSSRAVAMSGSGGAE